MERPPGSALFSRVATPARTLERIVELAVEIAREGREGHRVGTLFVIGDVEEVLARSRPLLLDPLAGHLPELRTIEEPAFWETVKELAQLDGAFVVAGDGTFVSAGRFIEIDFAAPSNFIAGLGTRHAAAASVTRTTAASAVVVSQSSVVRVFAAGELLAEIIPELFLLLRHESIAMRVRPAEARVTVQGGYEPDALVAVAGRPLRITFHRGETAPCSERVVFPRLGRSVFLPPFQDVTMSLLPERPGEYAFTCQNGVLRGRLTVVAAADA